jgi:hypothetical protein
MVGKMPPKFDLHGLLADTNRFAISIELLYIIIEIIQNRKWNLDKSDGEFVFSTFITQGKRYLVIAYNHYRSGESIEKEHTLFNWRQSVAEGEATIGTRGYGAKLLPFKIGGQYSNYYQLNNSDTFPTDLREWGLKESIDITSLQEKLNSPQPNADFLDDFSFRRIEPSTKKDGVSPTLLLDNTFISSPLYKFFQEKNFKYFYVFSNYDTAIDAVLDDTLVRLANMYESNTVKIYRSKDFATPTLITTSVEKSLGLCEKWWAGEFTLEWMLGEKDGLYWKSICRYYNKHTGQEIFSKLSSNGSKDNKFAIRHHYFTRENLERDWVPDIRVTVANTSDEYDTRNKLVGTDAANRVNIQIEGDFIDDACGDFGLNSKIRHFKEMSRIRVIVSLLSSRVKNINDFGLSLGHLKKNSSFSKGGAIYQMVLQTLGRAGDYFDIIRETATVGSAEAYANRDIVEKFRGCMQVDKKAAARSVTRKKEGILFEAKVADELSSKFPDMNWDHKDSHITAEHGLTGEGIDSLGYAEVNSKTLWVAIQVKDKDGGLTADDLNKFVVTLDSLKAKYPNDVFLSYLVLAKKKGFTSETYMEMLEKDITVVLDTNANKVANILDKQLNHISNIIS